MPSEAQIIAEIEYIMGTYAHWTIGITADPERRRQEHGNPSAWHHWDAGLESAARRIEKHFLDKGMKGDTDGGYALHYVYVF
jgi:hypothetical protein